VHFISIPAFPGPGSGVVTTVVVPVVPDVVTGVVVPVVVPVVEAEEVVVVVPVVVTEVLVVVAGVLVVAGVVVLPEVVVAGGLVVAVLPEVVVAGVLVVAGVVVLPEVAGVLVVPDVVVGVVLVVPDVVVGVVVEVGTTASVVAPRAPISISASGNSASHSASRRSPRSAVRAWMSSTTPIAVRGVMLPIAKTTS